MVETRLSPSCYVAFVKNPVHDRFPFRFLCLGNQACDSQRAMLEETKGVVPLDYVALGNE